MQLKEKLGSILQISKGYINPFTIGGLVFITWAVASRVGYIPNNNPHISGNNGNEDDEDHEGRHAWNVSQSILVATTVILCYYALRYFNPSTTIQTASGFQLPEGASILMPSDINKGSSNTIASQSLQNPKQQADTVSLLTGTPPF